MFDKDDEDLNELNQEKDVVYSSQVTRGQNIPN